MTRAFDTAASRLWLITPDVLETIMMVVDRMGDPEALATKVGRPLNNTRTVERRENGVAVVPITGPIVRYANIFTEISGGTSTQVLATDIQTALSDPTVRAIVLDINSPGGEATGINELAQMIFDARGMKPITAYVGGQASSAAYWIASAADRVVADRTAMLGSIGVISQVVVQDANPQEEKRGMRRYTIVSSVSPLKRVDPGTEAGRSEVQRIVDDLAQVFVESVARNRGTTVEDVTQNFGRGSVLIGDHAVAAGMADEIGSLESVIAELAGSASNHRRSQTMSAKSDKGLELQPGIYRVNAEGEITPLAIDAAFLSGCDAHKELVTKAIAEATPEIEANAAKKERARIAAIQALAPAGFEAQVTAAIEGGLSPEAAAAEILKAQKERGGPNLAAQREDATSVPHGGAAPTPGAGPDPHGWGKVVAKFAGAKA